MVCKYKKIYIFSPPNGVTGGPETLHMLCSIILKNGGDATMYYGRGKYNIPNNYLKYNISCVRRIKDDSQNLIIVPETDTNILNKYKKIKKMICFLSLDFYLARLPESRVDRFIKKYKLPKILKKPFINILNLFSSYKKINLRDSNILLSYNCEYIKQFFLENGINMNNTIYLCGPISSEHFSSDNIAKENIVAYNPKKGLDFTKKVIKNFKDEYGSYAIFVPIEKMKPNEVHNLLLRSKVYIDFGFFPGPERIPREAAVAKCNIIVGIDGSSSNDIDFPLPKRFKFEKNDENIKKICKAIYNNIENYYNFRSDFEEYINKVKNQENIFNDNIKKFFFREE